MKVAFLAIAIALGVLSSAQAQTAAPTPSITVHIAGFAYVPASFRIKPGDVVQFVNDDETAHTVTATDGSFDSGYLARGDRWTHAFANAGTYAYICTYHPFMKGAVTAAAP